MYRDIYRSVCILLSVICDSSVKKFPLVGRLDFAASFICLPFQDSPYKSLCYFHSDLLQRPTLSTTLLPRQSIKNHPHHTLPDQLTQDFLDWVMGHSKVSILIHGSLSKSWLFKFYTSFGELGVCGFEWWGDGPLISGARFAEICRVGSHRFLGCFVLLDLFCLLFSIFMGMILRIRFDSHRH